MKCIYCDGLDSKVVDSRPVDDGHAIRRRRECLVCGKRFTTYEKVETIPVLVVKKDGSREAFDIEKIKRGIIRACEKRPVSIEKIDHLASEVEAKVLDEARQEVTTTEIGELVIKGLKDLDLGKLDDVLEGLGGNEMVQEMAKKFLNDKTLKEIKKAIEKQDFDDVLKNLGSLKDVAKKLDFDDLSKASGNLFDYVDKYKSSIDMNKCQGLFDDLSKAAEKVLKTLSKK